MKRFKTNLDSICYTLRNTRFCLAEPCSGRTFDKKPVLYVSTESKTGAERCKVAAGGVSAAGCLLAELHVVLGKGRHAMPLPSRKAAQLRTNKKHSGAPLPFHLHPTEGALQRD